jgi:hypothetical protein
LKYAFRIGSEGGMIKLMKSDIKILIERQITKKIGFTPAITMRPVLSDVGAATVETRKENLKNKIDIDNLHQILGHCDETSARLTGEALGSDVVGTFDTFEACSIWKK